MGLTERRQIVGVIDVISVVVAHAGLRGWLSTHHDRYQLIELHAQWSRRQQGTSDAEQHRLHPANDIRRVISVSMQFEAEGNRPKGPTAPSLISQLVAGQLALYDHLEADGRWRLQERRERRYPGMGCSNKHRHRLSLWSAKFRNRTCSLRELLMLPDTFETARLVLRPVTLVDVDAIFDSYAQDEHVARYLIWRPRRSRSETQAYVERCIATPSEVERTYMLVGREDNIVRGAFALRRRAPHRLDCGYVLARRW